MEKRKILIKDTTPEERLALILSSLSCNESAGCENCSGCGIYGAGDPIAFYQDYIDGKKEISQINMEFYSQMFIR